MSLILDVAVVFIEARVALTCILKSLYVAELQNEQNAHVNMEHQ